MTHRTHDAILSVRVPRQLLEQLQAVKTRDGIPTAEQVRRALIAWFAAKKGKK